MQLGILVANIESVIDALPVSPIAMPGTPFVSTILPVMLSFIDDTGEVDAAQSLIY